MSREDYDLVVAGGGPAGSAASIAAARRGRRVLLLERSGLPFSKVCGEFLSAGGLELWRELTGRDLPAGAPPMGSVRFLAPGRATPAFAIDPPAWGLTRAFLDGALLETALQSGVEVRTRTALTSHARACGAWHATLDGPNGEEDLVAAHVVLATGRPLVLERRRRWWLGRKALCSSAALEADLELFLLPDGGYVGVSPVETGRLSICALTRGGDERWLEHPALSASEVEVGRSIARFTLGWQGSTADGAFCAGDAMAVWPPLVGDGITVAMASGALLGEFLSRPGRNGRKPSVGDWLRLWRQTFGRKLRLAMLLHRLAGRRASQAALIRLLGAMPRAGEWMVRLTRSRA